ncbi:NTP pyrophosphatase (non-canonical NTP hydrolase) [Desulfohalotomaculum tongense]|uniref:nucleotide pyrophosphohydrolase n=1 Tax=Desulforadius tongensis TaxID=1216062 RepID=UPI00195CD467|nr:NTP pyrophosphatase (non-canonical NTP hydrolase) [Desulforadius tongensis]
MEIKDVQRDVHKWISQFEEGYWHPLSMLARMTEEVGELAREINHRYGEKPKKPTEEEGSLALELGDILFIVACMANSLNIDLEEAFKDTMQKYYHRDINRWTKKSNAGPSAEDNTRE